jgi:MSHA pilin protein MshD
MRQATYKHKPASQAGFTLIEVIVSMVVMAIALTYLSTIFFTAPQKSVEPLLQVRAAEFGQALMAEILSKAYDEKTPLGGVPACNDGITECSSALRSDSGESRATFDDVDDYNDYCDTADPGPLVNSLGVELPAETFGNFRMSVCVFYDGNYDGLDDGAIANAKLIDTNIYLDIGGGRQVIGFQAYRSNF